MGYWPGYGQVSPLWSTPASCCAPWWVRLRREVALWALLLLICLLPLLAACSRAPVLPPLPPGSRVLVLGDSVSAGTGAQAGEDYPSHLAAVSRWDIINAGVPGDTSVDALKRLPELLDVHDPQMVIVEIGGNDFLRRRSGAAVQEDIRTIIRKSKASGARVLLVGVPSASVFTLIGPLQDDALYEDLAEEEEVLLLPDALADILSDPALRADRIHPNAAGYRVLAQRMADVLHEAGWLGPAAVVSTP